MAALRLRVLLPRLLIDLGPRERVTNDELDALTRRRIPEQPALRLRSRTLRVLAERELDAGQRALEQQVLRFLRAPAQLDDHCLAADRIRAAVQDVRDREAAGKVAMYGQIGRVEHLAHAGHRADGRRPFVDGVVGDVRVRVDDAGRHELAGAVDDLRPRRDLDVRPDRRNLAVAQDDGAVLNRAAGGGDDRRVPDRDHAWRCRRPGLTGLASDAGGQDRPRRQHGGRQCREGDERKTQGSTNQWSLQKERAARL